MTVTTQRKYWGLSACIVLLLVGCSYVQGFPKDPPGYQSLHVEKKVFVQCKPRSRDHMLELFRTPQQPLRPTVRVGAVLIEDRDCEADSVAYQRAADLMIQRLLWEARQMGGDAVVVDSSSFWSVEWTEETRYRVHGIKFDPFTGMPAGHYKDFPYQAQVGKLSLAADVVRFSEAE